MTILGPDGRPAAGGWLSLHWPEIREALGRRLDAMWDGAWRERTPTLYGADNRLLPLAGDTRVGDTVTIKLPERFK